MRGAQRDSGRANQFESTFPSNAAKTQKMILIAATIGLDLVQTDIFRRRQGKAMLLGTSNVKCNAGKQTGGR